MNALRVSVLIASGVAALFACGSGDLVVGDDTRASGEDGGGDGAIDDGGPTGDGGTDARVDAEAGPCTSLSGLCVETGSPCRGFDDLGACTSAGERCCTSSCPAISPPAPGFCDGGPVATKYDSFGCTVGFACAPITCTSAGGQCVGLAPTSCPDGHFGDSTTYTCGPGVGVGCCLP